LHTTRRVDCGGGPQYRIVCLDVPGNPTGTVMTRRQAARLLKASTRARW
jgi:histidinol-phosphate/aromatic aminotransferase/cobyric acid decarboxylase-like protein